MLLLYVIFFFFKQKTAYEMRISDWSSDVCSSDLSRFSDFALHIRAIVRSQSLPGYVLELVPGTGSETLLVMRPSVIEIGLRPVDNLPRQKRRICTSDAMPIGTSNAVLSVLRTHASQLNLWPDRKSTRLNSSH